MSERFACWRCSAHDVPGRRGATTFGAVRGPGGYYALAAGSRVPPLTFDDDEILTLVAGLRMVEDRSADTAAARALTKLLQVLPRRLAAVAREVREGSETVRRGSVDLDLER
jgi:predicted DNA-binding transcriptional regulator YafY